MSKYIYHAKSRWLAYNYSTSSICLTNWYDVEAIKVMDYKFKTLSF